MRLMTKALGDCCLYRQSPIGFLSMFTVSVQSELDKCFVHSSYNVSMNCLPNTPNKIPLK